MGCTNSFFNWDGYNGNYSLLIQDPVTRTLTVNVYNPTDCTGPVQSTWVLPDAPGNTQYAGTCNGPATGVSRYQLWTNNTRFRVFDMPKWIFSVATTVPSYVLGGVTLTMFGDQTCSGTPSLSLTLYSGVCVAGLAITSGNSAQGWAQLLNFPGNDCTAAPVDTITFSTTECTLWDSWGAWVKLTSADTSAPATPPLELLMYADAACMYGDWPAGGPQAGIHVPWTNINPMTPACNQGYWPVRDGQPWNTTKISMSAPGVYDIFIYGASDTTCTGPVYSSFRGLTYTAGNTRTSGTCTPATTGAGHFAQSHVGQTSGWVRLGQSPAFAFAVKTKCTAVAPATGTTATASSAGSADTTTGPTVAGVVVGVFVLGGIGAAAYFHYARAGASAAAKTIIHNPAV